MFVLAPVHIPKSDQNTTLSIMSIVCIFIGWMFLLDVSNSPVLKERVRRLKCCCFLRRAIKVSKPVTEKALYLLSGENTWVSVKRDGIMSNASTCACLVLKDSSKVCSNSILKYHLVNYIWLKNMKNNIKHGDIMNNLDPFPGKDRPRS